MKNTAISLLLLTLWLRFGSALAQSGDADTLWSPYRITPRTGVQHVDLSGSGWELSHADQPVTNLSQPRKDRFETTVPNSVHWSYYKAGKLPHPYANKNSDQYGWLDEKAWYYRKTFATPANAAGMSGPDPGNLVFLCFDGVDYFAKVWLNGTLLGVHEGMFGGPSVEVSKLLKPSGNNELTVEVRAGNWGNKATAVDNLPRTASGERDYSKRTGYNPRRSGKIIKPWVISGGSGAEMFFSVGMWQGVRLEIVPPYHLERPYLTTVSATDKQAQLHLSCEVLADTHSLDYRLHPWNNVQIHHHDGYVPGTTPSNAKLSVLIELRDKDGKAVVSQEKPFVAFKGRTWLEEDLLVNNPKLWHPNGLGDANLYTAQVTLKKDGKVADKLTFTTGIRTIERVATAGPRYGDRWENWQFIVNGRKLFVKGMNFTPQDVLLDLPRERYRWTLRAAKDMGVQLIRVWGGGLLESDYLYEICNEQGIMVWQDFPIGNQDTPDYPQDVWEAQVVQNIVRLRNHPSLAVWCGGNEFNPYSLGNAATMGILERNLDIFDKSRLFVRTTPDDGSIHTYPDMDPVWYGVGYRNEPWISETGMHSIPEPGLLRELVSDKEFAGLGKMWDTQFGPTHPEFIHHFAEYGPGRVPRMISRASHIADMNDPSLESIAEASQIGAGEFYQVLSEKVQGNYPATAGLMPWVFKRHWPVIAIQLMDWFGHAGAPYYFLKRTYEPTHVALDMDRLLWSAGDRFPVKLSITHAGEQVIKNGKVTVRVLDKSFKPLWQKEQVVSLAAGPSVQKVAVGELTLPADYRDAFFFVRVDLADATGKLISRSTYWPRTTSKLDDAAFREKYLTVPLTPWPTFEKGPWLKPTVSASTTKLTVAVLDETPTDGAQSRLRVRVRNAGTTPAFMTQLDAVGAKRAMIASDNYFWLEPGESRDLTADVHWRSKPAGASVSVRASAWNAPAVSAALHPEKYGVLNRGISGHNTRDLLARLDTDVLANKPKVVILKVGTNDMVNSKKFMPLAEYERNLNQLVSRIKASGATVLLLTPLPVDDAYLFTRHDRALYDKTPTDHIQRSLAVVQRVARAQQVAVIDTHELFAKHGEPKRTADSWLQNEANANRPDGVHPNAAGYRAMAQRIADYLRTHTLPTEGIVCFGDSITYGLNVAGAGTTEGDSYPAQLRQLLTAGTL